MYFLCSVCSIQPFRHMKRCDLQKCAHRQAAFLEMDVAPLLARLEHNGIGFDGGKLEETRQAIEQRTSDLQVEAEGIIGHKVNLASPPQLSQVLYEELKLASDKKTTDNGGSSTGTSEAILKDLAAKHRFPAIVLEFRALAGPLAMHDGQKACAQLDGEGFQRIYPHWNQVRLCVCIHFSFVLL